MAAIDAKVVLGLAGKMGQVFVHDGTYQAFPLAPIGLKVDTLRALVTDPFGAGANAHAQFSLLVNEIPTGPLWQPEVRRLWDVYGEVLSQAELLEGTRTPKQQKAYDKAFALLYDEADVLPTPSAVVVAYERHRDAYLAVAMEYNNRKGEASVASADPTVHAAWESDEPKLRSELEAAAAAWAGPGRRAEVEEARRVIRDLGSDSPQVAWAGYRRLFDPDLPEIFFRTSVDGLSYVPTSYVPTDVADVAWPRITVTAEELTVLADAAPEQLRTRLGSGHDAGVEKVSFEYSYITVARPWFSPQLFASEGWRFRDRERMLSDGGSPPQGECTAYVTGLVLARNIAVRHRADSGAAAADLGFLPNVASMETAQFRALRTVEVGQPDVPQLRVAVLDDPAVWAARSPGDPSVAAAPVSTALRRDVLLGEGTRLAELVPSLRNPDLIRPLPAPETAEPLAETTTAPDEIYVLALQCRLLPRCPASTPATDRSDRAGRSKRYTVAAGDTLAKIAAAHYGDPQQWQKIYAANRDVVGDDPNVLRVGQQLTIPSAPT